MTAVSCIVIFSWMVTGGTFRFDDRDAFGDFFDHQAASLLRARLDVPPEAIGLEAFVIDGKYYGYFGVTPSLLRLPMVILDVGFGRLTRTFMLCFYALGLLAAYATLCHLVRIVAKGQGAAGMLPTHSRSADTNGATRRPPAWTPLVFTLNVGLGTTLFFLGSRAFVYNEAILCGVAFALVSGYCSLRYLAAPAERWWIGALVCGVLSLQARVPTGFFALSLVACSALAVFFAAFRSARVHPPDRTVRALSRPVAVAAVSALCLLTFPAVSYLKFKTFEGLPVRYHVQYHPTRLARTDGQPFYLINVPYNFERYFWHPDLDVRPTFPYVYAHGILPADWRGRIDHAEPVLAVPYSMPALFLVAFFGGLYAVFRVPALRGPVLVVAAGTLPLMGMMLTMVWISHRYTADLCPPLILASAMGLAALDTVPRRHRAALHASAAALTLCSIFVTFALTLNYQWQAPWGVPDDVKQRYQEWRQTIDGALGL